MEPPQPRTTERERLTYDTDGLGHAGKKSSHQPLGRQNIVGSVAEINLGCLETPV